VLEHRNTVGIGHGVSIGAALLKKRQQIMTLDQWLKDVIAKHIVFEVCLTSNQSIDSSGSSFEYLDEMMKYGIMCALGTDDPAIFGITLCDEYLKYAKHLWCKCFRKGSGMGLSIEGTIVFVQDLLKTLANNSLKYAGMDERLQEENLNRGIDTSSVNNDEEFPPFPREPFQTFVKALHKCDVHTHIGALFPRFRIAECLAECLGE
jgi:hypothetical protein